MFSCPREYIIFAVARGEGLTRADSQAVHIEPRLANLRNSIAGLTSRLFAKQSRLLSENTFSMPPSSGGWRAEVTIFWSVLCLWRAPSIMEDGRLLECFSPGSFVDAHRFGWDGSPYTDETLKPAAAVQ